MDKKEEQVRSLLTNSGIQWSPMLFSNKIPVISKIYDLYKFRAAASSITAKENFDLVHCRSYVPAQVGFQLKRKYGLPVLFDTRGFWVDERVDKNIWNLSNPIFRLIYWWYKKLERKFYRNADSVLTLTRNAKNKILQNYALPGNQIKIIPCATDAGEFAITTAEKRVQAKKRLGLQGNEYCLGYLGSLGGWYDLTSMLNFYNKFRKMVEPSRFVFFTPQSPGPILKSCLKNGIDPSEIIVQYIDHKALDDYLNAFDISILLVRNCISRSACSPTRIGELWAKGIPVIVNEGIGDLDAIYSANELGKLYDPQKSFDRADLLRHLETDAIKLRGLAMEHFNFQKAIDTYLECYNELRK